MKSFLFLVASLCFTVLLLSCGASKKSNHIQQESKSQPIIETSVDNPNQLPEPEVIEPAPTKTTHQVSENDTLYFTLERTACFGRCPIFVFEVYDSGYVFYEGIKFVEPEGSFKTYLSKEEMKWIAEEAEKIGYFNLSDKYDHHITDIPSTLTSLKMDGKRKKGNEQAQCPTKT